MSYTNILNRSNQSFEFIDYLNSKSNAVFNNTQLSNKNDFQIPSIREEKFRTVRQT